MFEKLEVEMVGSTPADTIRLKIIQEQFPKKTLGMQLRDAAEMSNEAHVGGISSSAVEDGLLDIRDNFGMQRDQVCDYVHVHPDLWTMGMGAGVFRVLDALYPRQY